MTDPNATDPGLAKVETAAKSGWTWLELHPLILGVLIGVFIGLAAGAYIFGK